MVGVVFPHIIAKYSLGLCSLILRIADKEGDGAQVEVKVNKVKVKNVNRHFTLHRLGTSSDLYRYAWSLDALTTRY